LCCNWSIDGCFDYQEEDNMYVSIRISWTSEVICKQENMFNKKKKKKKKIRDNGCCNWAYIDSIKPSNKTCSSIAYHTKTYNYMTFGLVGFGFMVFNATFNNISVISWRSVLLVEETGIPGENHRPAANHWQTLSHKVA